MAFRAATRGVKQGGQDPTPRSGVHQAGLTLPKGIYHDAHMHENGQWYLCLKPDESPRPENDNRRVRHWEWAPTPTARNTRTPRQPTKWRRNFEPGARRQRGSRGWWEAQRRHRTMPPEDPWTAQHQMGHQVRTGHRERRTAGTNGRGKSSGNCSTRATGDLPG